jgi:dipeptidase E
VAQTNAARSTAITLALRRPEKGTSVRMYLSSHRLGDHPEQLLTLLHTPGPVAVIANALDAAPAEIRAHGVHDELAALRDLGLTAEELDLRDYVADHQRLADTVTGYRLVWLRGGNAFVLRYALARCLSTSQVDGPVQADACGGRRRPGR